jgi:hypothetical protein
MQFASFYQVFSHRPDLELSLDTRVMIKSNQHMFPNKILVKIDDLCENPENKSADFTEFHRLKKYIEDPFTEVEFPGMFPIKTHHFCRKNTKNLWNLCFGVPFYLYPTSPSSQDHGSLSL